MTDHEIFPIALVITFYFSLFVTGRGNILTGGCSIEKFLVNVQEKYSFVQTHIAKKPQWLSGNRGSHNTILLQLFNFGIAVNLLWIVCMLGALLSKKTFAAFLYSVWVCWLAQRIWLEQSPEQFAADGFAVRWPYFSSTGQKEHKQLRNHISWMYKILKQAFFSVYSKNMYPQYILRRGWGRFLSLGSIQMILAKSVSGKCMNWILVLNSRKFWAHFTSHQDLNS